MFNHKIIFRFFSLVLIAGIFFGLSEACTLGVGVRAGYGVAGYGSMPTTCQFGTYPSSSRFNNTKSQLEGDDNFKYLVNVYGLAINDDCYSNDTLVSQIQTRLSGLPGCTTCVDGKYGYHTKYVLSLSSCRPTCSPGNEPNTDGLCNPGYTPDTNIGCCIAPECSEPKMSLVNGSCTEGYIGDGAGCCVPDCSEGEKMSLVNGSCTEGYIGDGAGCCIPDCQGDKKPILENNDCSDQPGYKYENGCCIPDNPGNSNIQQRENNCGLPPGTLNDTTVSCINLQGNDCCIDTGCRPQPEPKPGLVDCSAETLNPNTCTADGQIGNLSGTSRVCKDCPVGEKPNSGHTNCICDPTKGCCGIQLNTVVPFIGDCIQMSNDESAGNITRVNALNAFPILMGSLSKMLVTAILIFSFVMVVIGGVLIIAGGIDPGNAKKGKDIIFKVIVGLALLGASGIILRLINPNFFG